MTSAPREGDLFFTNASNYFFFQGRSGIIQIVSEGGIASDEDHVTVRWLNGNFPDDLSEETVDRGSGKFEGISDEKPGSVVVKWKAARLDRDTKANCLSEFVPILGKHEVWPARKFTKSGWALAKDPWGIEHWLPPRITIVTRGDGQGTKKDKDQDYCFHSKNGIYRYEVAMQGTKQDGLTEDKYWMLTGSLPTPSAKGSQMMNFSTTFGTVDNCYRGQMKAGGRISAQQFRRIIGANQISTNMNKTDQCKALEHLEEFIWA